MSYKISMMKNLTLFGKNSSTMLISRFRFVQSYNTKREPLKREVIKCVF
jgi:hypothetical protein